MTLSEYELLRLKRIQRNAERLQALGLDQSPLKKVKPKKKNIVSKIKRIKPGQERRSRRLASSKKDNELVMLDYYSAKDDEENVSRQNNEDYDYEDDSDDNGESEDVTTRQRSGFRNATRTKRMDSDKWKLSKEDRKSLASADDNFMAKFQEFLAYKNRISEQNMRNVMRQARKLANGQGIRYESPRYGWPEGCYFKKGKRITPMSDIVELMMEGQACEDKWGRDHGNGWLIAHPLKKLLLFQQFILNNPDFLTSKLRLKDYCE